MSDELIHKMAGIGIEALRHERDDLVRGIDRIQLTAVKWARAAGGNTPLAIIASELRGLIGDRATEPSSEEGQRRIGATPSLETGTAAVPTPCICPFPRDKCPYCYTDCARCFSARETPMGKAREPYVERDGWRDYGDISAVPPWYAVPMECDPCKVKWRGCADVFECPVCGKGTPPWNPEARP